MNPDSDSSHPNSGFSTPIHPKQFAPPTAASLSNARTPSRRSFLARLHDDVSLSYADIPILACCMVSGLCDSVAFNATGTFASMQTGASSSHHPPSHHNPLPTLPGSS